MALTVKHAFISAVPDDPAALAAGEVVPQAHWNAAHTITGSALPASWFNVKDYGALGNGVANDTTAINNAIAAFNAATAGVLYFPAGNYLVNSSLTTITASGRVLGEGMGGTNFAQSGASPNTPVTCISFSSGSTPLFTVGPIYLKFEDIYLLCTVATPTAGSAGVVCTHATNAFIQTDFFSVTVYGFYINVDVQVGSAWNMVGCIFVNPVLYSVKIRNIVNVDIGDWLMSGCTFVAMTRAATSAIRMESSGGGKIIGCKVNGVAATSSCFVNGIDILGGAGTSDLLVSACSIENFTGVGILNNGDWKNITITGCQFLAVISSAPICISIIANSQVAIANCVFINGPAIGGFAISTASGSSNITVLGITQHGFGGAEINGVVDLVGYVEPIGGVGNSIQVNMNPSATGSVRSEFLTSNDVPKRFRVGMRSSTDTLFLPVNCGILAPDGGLILCTDYPRFGFTGFFDISLRAGGVDATAEVALVNHQGNFVLGRQGALASTATDGFLYIPTTTNPPTGVPTTFTGSVPMVYDTAHNKFYIYNGGWKGGTVPGTFS